MGNRLREDKGLWTFEHHDSEVMVMRSRHVLPTALALLALASAANAQYTPKLAVRSHAAEIEKLQLLSPKTAKRQASSDVDSKMIAGKCADELEKVQSYGSYIVFLDREAKELRKHNSLGSSYTFDHVAPDRYHVVRSSWGGGPGYDFDEWIATGDSFYLLTSIWFEGIENALAAAVHNPQELNLVLGLQKYVNVLREEKPVSGGTYLYGGKPYHLLVYQFSADRHPGFPKWVASGPARLALWIDSQTGLLAQGDFKPLSENEEKPAGREFQQVVVTYSGEIHVDPVEQRCSKDRPAFCFVLIPPSTAPSK